MNVLITNDDGIESPGLRALVDVLSIEHDVWVAAPEGERSGSSLAISLHGAVRFRKLDERLFACSGTPADCVLYGCLGAVDCKPDIVLSGINLGPNLGTDIMYSGTVGAARQASLMGIPGVAVSVVGRQAPYYFTAAAEFVRRNLDSFVSLWTEDHLLNINVPNIDAADLPTVVTRPSRRIYRDRLDSFSAPNRDIYYFLHGDAPETIGEHDSDWEAVSAGRISVCPVLVHPGNWTGESVYGDGRIR